MMRNYKLPRLPVEIETEIRLMARADSRSYEDELRRLLRRGLSIPKECSLGDEASLVAELAYLRSLQIEESTEE